MYIQNTHAQDVKNISNVPVQTFADSFSTAAYMKDLTSQNNPKKYNEPSHGDSVASNETVNDFSLEKNGRKTFLGMNFEDLLLIGLLLLYISDNDKQEDKMIPVILSILLLI